MSATTEKKALFDNAISMAVRSLKPSISGTMPVNFVNGRNASPKHKQDADLLIVAAVEGYSTSLWATPRQISEVGGVVSADATRVPIFVDKVSKAGNTYLTSYEVVNFDCVLWPNGMPMECVNRVTELMTNPKPYTVTETIPAPKPPPPPHVPAPKPLPARNVPAPVTNITIPETSKAPKKSEVKRSNMLDRNERQHTDGTRTPNVVLDLKEYGIHVEARTFGEAQLLLDAAVAAHLALRK